MKREAQVAAKGFDAILQAGGWRLFMRQSSAEYSDLLTRAGTDQLAGNDSLSLARAFVLAKQGRTLEARDQVDRYAGAC